MTKKFNPYKAQIEFAQAVNDAIMYKVNFQIFRTVDGKVQKFDIRMIDIDFGTGDLWIDFKIGEEIKFEKASKQDLQLLSARARQLAAVHK